MSKRKIKKDKQLSTKHTHQSNIEQQQILILSSPPVDIPELVLISEFFLAV
jgi:hypothetical protein